MMRLLLFVLGLLVPIVCVQKAYAQPEDQRSKLRWFHTFEIWDLMEQLTDQGIEQSLAEQYILSAVSNSTIGLEASIVNDQLKVKAHESEAESLRKAIEQRRMFGFGEYYLQLHFGLIGAETRNRWMESLLDNQESGTLNVCLLDEEHAVELREFHERFSSPRIDALNGQTVELCDQVERTFTVGLLDESLKNGFEPKRQVVREGLAIQLQSVEDADRVSTSIHMNCHWTKVLGITESKLHEMPIEVPLVSTLRTKMQLHVPYGSSVVVIGHKTTRENSDMFHAVWLEIKTSERAIPGQNGLTKFERLAAGFLPKRNENAAGQNNGNIAIIQGPIRVLGSKDSEPSTEELLIAIERAKVQLDPLSVVDRTAPTLRIVKQWKNRTTDPPAFVPLVGWAERLHTYYTCWLMKGSEKLLEFEVDYQQFEMQNKPVTE